MDTDKNLTPERSLALINETLEGNRRAVLAGSGKFFLLWGAVLFVFSLVHREDLAMKQVALAREANRPVYKAMVLLVLFCAAIVLLGFFPAMVLFIPALMYLLKCRNRKWMAATTAGVLVFVYVVFGLVLNTQFPVSIFLE